MLWGGHGSQLLESRHQSARQVASGEGGLHVDGRQSRLLIRHTSAYVGAGDDLERPPGWVDVDQDARRRIAELRVELLGVPSRSSIGRANVHRERASRHPLSIRDSLGDLLTLDRRERVTSVPY